MNITSYVLLVFHRTGVTKVYFNRRELAEAARDEVTRRSQWSVWAIVLEVDAAQGLG